MNSKLLLIFYFLSEFSSATIHEPRNCRERGRTFFNSSLPLPPTSQTPRHQPGDYCRELTSAHKQQSDSNREPLVYERKSLTTTLRARDDFSYGNLFMFQLQLLLILVLLHVITSYENYLCKHRICSILYFSVWLADPLICV